MIQVNELIMFLIGIGTLFFILWNRHKLRKVSSAGKLFLAYYFLFAGWCLTIIEGFIFPVYLNLIEHICYSSSALILLFWAWKTFYFGEIRR